MRDRTFQGPDVAAAVLAAEKALGLPKDRLRYVVLKEGTSGGLGISPSPAEIAVLVEETREAHPAPEALPPAEDPRALVVKVLKELVEAAGLDIGVRVEEDQDTLAVGISGPDHVFFLENDGEVLEAVQYLLRRALPSEGFPRLVLDCEGRREVREEGLRRTAQELAAQVLADGAARTTEPLNSYERRIIHMTIAETRGLRTESVGEGADRRVTIKPVFPEDIE
jgi:spoIIIJ-associated protein